MNKLSDFENLASETGIGLPPLLKSLMATGQTEYHPDWSSLWKEQMLKGKPSFMSWYDFEWTSAADSRHEIDNWLNPAAQNGLVFLPFAMTGAGDRYCLMPMDGASVGVALIWHDDEDAEMGYASFDDFVCAKFLQTFANLSPLEDDPCGFSEAEILQCVRADVSSVAGLINEAAGQYLTSFCQQPITRREFRYGPKTRPENVLSLISQAQLEQALLRFPKPDAAPFKIIPAWEINPPSLAASTAAAPPPEPVADWRTLAANPQKKLAAIQLYRQEFGVSLAQAKSAIEQYLQETQK